MTARSWRGAVACAAVALLTSACGGGGDPATGGGGAKFRKALPALSQDILPAGARQDLRSSNYFPMTPGDNWSYELVIGSFASGQPLTRSVSAGSGSNLILSETAQGVTDNSTIVRTSEGLLQVQPLGTQLPAAATQRIGNVLEYAEPFYAKGSTRSVIRQGDWGADLDGDGVNESFRFEYSQVLVDFESMFVVNGPIDNIAHFRNQVTLILQPSSPAQPILTLTSTEDAWFAPGIGLVRSMTTFFDSSATTQELPESISILSGQVSGVPLFTLPIDGTLIKVPLAHNALVFDARRNRYLASVPGNVLGSGNSIASIDAITGAVSNSSPVGSEPSALAINADGTALFVGLNGAGEVLKLRLPDMVELWRVRLPDAGFFGQLFAEQLAASPTEPDVVAVSMFRSGFSPRHGGVALVRAGVLQPLMTQDHTGSNLIAFDGNGRFVYGFNNETTEFGLRRIAVLPDGLQQEQVVTAGGNFGTRSLVWADGRLLLDNWVYRTPDLSSLAQVNVLGGACHPAAVPNRLICLWTSRFANDAAALAVVDATTFVVQSTPFFVRHGLSGTPWDIVPGAAGQTAIRINPDSPVSFPTAVWLFNSAHLR